MKKFQQENGREPSKTERETGAGTWYKEYRQLSKVLKEMEGPGGPNSRASLIMGDMDEDIKITKLFILNVLIKNKLFKNILHF